MAVYKEINRADGSGVTTFYRISDVLDTAETDDQEGQAVIIDYNQAQNKPSINGVTLIGNKTTEDLGLQPAGDYITNDEADEKFIDEDELESKNYVNQAELQDAIAHIEHFHREIVEALPVTGMDNVLYMVRKGGTGEDIYNEYIWVGLSSNENGYEFLGTTATDLTDYYKKSQVDAALATKVDKEGGKGLSEQNYTLAEKTKLAGLENYDDTEIQAEVSGLNTDVNNLKSSNVTISNTLAELKPNVESNTAAVSTIYDLLDNKMTAIRLVEQGDGWVWMNLEGSRLTYAQASAALGHENCMLFIEQLENDGKVIPAEYKSEGDHINVIFKDLDSLVHIMTCGEDDVVVTEDVTTTNRQADFTIEDEAVGYTTKMTALYGNTSQNTTTGKNLFNIEGRYETGTGIEYTKNSDGSYTLNGTANGNNFLRGVYHLNEQHTLSYTSNVSNSNVILRTRTGTPSAQTGIQDQLAVSSTSGNLTSSKQFDFVEISIVSGTTLNNFKIYIQLEKGSSVTSFEPCTGGQASPNPDYPQDIHVVSGNNTIEVVGKNLFDKDNAKHYSTNGSGNTTTTTQFNSTDYIPCNSGDSFTISGIPTTTSDYNLKVVFFDSNKNYISRPIAQIGTINVKGSYSTTAPTNAKYVMAQFYNTLEEAQFEKGTEATTYEPYQKESYPINLGNIELCKIGDYQDYIHKDNGKWYLNKQIGKVVLDGSESDWGNGSTDTTGYNRWRKVLDNPLPATSISSVVSTFCNALTSVSVGDTYSRKQGIGIDIQNNYAFFYIDDVASYTLANFKTWLASNNLIVYYILATPTTTEITDTTLISQLNALEQITQYKHTYITITGANLTPEADFTYIRNIVINNNDTVLGKDTYWNNKVPTSADLPSNAQEGEIRIVQDTKNVYIYDGTNWIPFDKGGEIDLSNYLAKDNTTAWIPTGAFNPATKKYVDDSVGGVFVPTKTSQLQNDSNFIGKNSSDLTYYYTKSQTYNKAEVDDLIQGGGGGTSDYTALSNKPQINGTTLTGNKTGSDLGLVSSADVLTKTNTTSYTPSGDYQPATKKYVDDAIQAALASYIANNINVNPTDTSDKNIWIETE